jgi:inner membrane protein
LDSLTHIALGACIGEAFAGKTVGKKAMLWGILAQSIPDIDFLAAMWLDTSSNLLAHRGFTHSILFAAILTPFLALAAEKWHRPHNISFLKWTAFFASTILSHILLDAFNNYGVGWFEPFNHYRISFNILYVADPFFSVAPGLACLFLLFARKKRIRGILWKSGLLISFLYLIYAIYNKINIDQDVKRIFSKQQINYSRYFTTPAPLQHWLWFVVAGNDSGYYVGYRSVFDNEPTMPLNYFPKNDALIVLIKNKPEVAQLIRFSKGYYTIERNADTLLFNDLRFGQVTGWYDPAEKFSFHYYLQPDMDNTLVVQRGRFANWNRQTFLSFIRRIKGN